jgi:ABC-type sugar transport system ATPase subunit
MPGPSAPCPTTMNPRSPEQSPRADPAPAHAGAVVEIEAATKSFGTVEALRGASLALHAGRVTALVGDNGAGKSTLVKILSGVLQPDGGKLYVGGREVELRDPQAARQHGIHTAFQDLALVGSLSTVENMFLGDELRVKVAGMRTPWLDRKAMRREAERALANLGITTLSDVERHIQTLSGGQRQTVAIARAVREAARVVILDEPTAALGVKQSNQVLRLVERLRESGTAVLVISHNLREVFEVSDNVVVLRLGQAVAEFETRETDEEAVVAAIVGARFRQRTTPAAEEGSP